MSDDDNRAEKIVYLFEPAQAIERAYIPFPPSASPDTGAVLEVAADMFGSSGTSVRVERIIAYPSGFRLHVGWRLKPDATRTTSATEHFFNLNKVMRSGGHPSQMYPVFSMDYGGDVEPASTAGLIPTFSNVTPTQKQALVFDGNSYYPMDDGGYYFQTRIWSWPLPPARALTLTLEWASAGISANMTRIDGKSVVDAANSLS